MPTKDELPEVVLAWMHDKFHESLLNLYDDPIGYSDRGEDGETVATAIADAYEELRVVSLVLELDFQDMIEQNSSDYEKGRIDAYLLAADSEKNKNGK